MQKLRNTAILILGIIMMISLLCGYTGTIDFSANEIVLYRVGDNDITMSVEESKVKDYLETNEWATVPSQMLYAEDGRKQIFPMEKVEAQKTVGWYVAPVVRVYDVHGNNTLVFQSDLSHWSEQGWFTFPVMYVYHTDGRTEIIAISELETYKANGWSETKQDSLKTKRFKEYPIASEVWYSLKDAGYSDMFCSGVIGNFMVETAGGGFYLKPDSNSNRYYGLAQWGGGRKTLLLNRYGSSPSTAQQVQYMLDELLGENNTKRQVTAKQYNIIVNASSPEESALAFAKYFERCGSASYSKRQKCARIAYNYFVG